MAGFLRDVAVQALGTLLAGLTLYVLAAAAGVLQNASVASVVGAIAGVGISVAVIIYVEYMHA